MESMNRTGVDVSPHAREMLEVTKLTTPTPGDASILMEVQSRYHENAPELGTIPPPSDPKKTKKLDELNVAAFLDRLGERLAFERSGTRLYDALLMKLETSGGFEGGPELEDLQHFRNEEARHFDLLCAAARELGADPTAVTPSANLAAVESQGLCAAITDHRTTLGQSLHAILVAELADNEGWSLLIEMAEELGLGKLAKAFAKAKEAEDEHLVQVREWVNAHAMSTFNAEA